MHIAITGSIGSGKSEVCSILKDLGYPVLSADAMVDTLYQSEAVKAGLVKLLGSSALTCMNEIDKAYVSFRIFNYSSERKKVESFLHPLVYKRLMEEAKRIDSKLVFSEVPLLFESNGQAYFDSNLLITCDEDVALLRLVEHRKMSLEDAKKRLDAQMPVHQKKALADAVIENNSTQEVLREKVIQYLHSLAP